MELLEVYYTSSDIGGVDAEDLTGIQFIKTEVEIAFQITHSCFFFGAQKRQQDNPTA